MGFFLYVSLIFAIGILLSISAHLYWQGNRQLMPATGGIALLAAYLFILTSNAGIPFGICCVIAILTGGLVGLLLQLSSHGISRAEFMLLGLALIEIVRRAAYIFSAITEGTNGLSLDGLSWATAEISASIVALIVLLVLIITSRIWRSSIGTALRLVGASPRGATLIGININKYELGCATLGGSLAATAGFFYAITIRYIHPDDFGLNLCLPALAAGLAFRPRFVLLDIPALSFILFGLREMLRFIGTGTVRFALHDLLIGIFLVTIAVRLGRHTNKEDDKQ